MEGKSRSAGLIRERDVRGLKYFDQLAPLLQRLHDVGCAGDRAGNRSLHFDNYCMLVLLFLFNPIVTSLRGLQQASELSNVQKKLGCPRTSLGSLSESVSCFDPQRLVEIIAELGGQLVNCLVALQGGQGDLGLERRRVLLPLRHRTTSRTRRYSLPGGPKSGVHYTVRVLGDHEVVARVGMPVSVVVEE